MAAPCCERVPGERTVLAGVLAPSSAAGRSGRAGCREERSTSLTPAGFSHGQVIRVGHLHRDSVASTQASSESASTHAKPPHTLERRTVNGVIQIASGRTAKYVDKTLIFLIERRACRSKPPWR